MLDAKFDLQQYLIQTQSQVDDALESYLPKGNGMFKTIHKSMRYSVFAGGKRLRPILCLASYGIFSEDLKAMPVACALELIHTYSLIHDDLPCMDDDDLRRGKPTNHKVYGEAIAVLSGDALLTLAFEWIAKADFKADIIVKVTKELSVLSGSLGLIGGQVLDLEAEGKEIKENQLESIHLHKTAALMKASATLGGILAGAKSGEIKRLAQYGEKLGLAFQIVDDVLDVESSEEILGKKTQKDSTHKKATYPSIIGLEKSKDIASEFVEEAIDALEPFENKAIPLRALAQFVVERNK